MELCASDRRSIKKNNFFTINKAGKINPLTAGIFLKHEKKGLIDSVWKTLFVPLFIMTSSIPDDAERILTSTGGPLENQLQL